jgi:fructose-1,6-bisphosphatase/inositol monophosphatase family enzyme
MKRVTPITTIVHLLDHVRNAGQHAYQAQGRRPVEKQFKDDGSVVTALDKEVEHILAAKIAEIFPNANIMGEESDRELNGELLYTFLLDPIDGTDAFSQGMPSWCVSVGLLNDAFEPVAGILFAPALELLLFADVNQPAEVNGRSIQVDGMMDKIEAFTNIMIPSSAHQFLDLHRYPGKARSMGSAALHLIYPLIYPRVFAALESKGAHAWDIAGAHAINRSVGFDIEYFDGRKIDYHHLMEGQPVGDVIISGSPERIAALKPLVRVI